MPRDGPGHEVEKFARMPKRSNLNEKYERPFVRTGLETRLVPEQAISFSSTALIWAFSGNAGRFA